MMNAEDSRHKQVKSLSIDNNIERAYNDREVGTFDNSRLEASACTG